MVPVNPDWAFAPMTRVRPALDPSRQITAYAAALAGLAVASSGSRMNRSHLKHSTASTARASTSRMASSYPRRYLPGLVGSLQVTPMSLSDSRNTTVQHETTPRLAA
jgi:hypothetical protein